MTADGTLKLWSSHETIQRIWLSEGKQSLNVKWATWQVRLVDKPGNPQRSNSAKKQRGCWTLPCSLFKEQSSKPNWNSKTSKPSHYCARCCRLLLTNHFHYWSAWQHCLRRPHLQCDMGIFMLNCSSTTRHARPVVSSRAPYQDCKFDRINSNLSVSWMLLRGRGRRRRLRLHYDSTSARLSRQPDVQRAAIVQNKMKS